MNRFDVLGFTLAEVALVVLFVFLAVGSRNHSSAQALAADLSQARQQIAALSKDAGSLRRENATLVDKNRIVEQKLRSVATPTCSELGLKPEWLFIATVRGRDKYQIEQTELTLEAIRMKYTAQFEAAKRQQCVYRAKLYYGSGTSGEDYDYALRRIRGLVYVTLFGPA